MLEALQHGEDDWPGAQEHQPPTSCRGWRGVAGRGWVLHHLSPEKVPGWSTPQRHPPSPHRPGKQPHRLLPLPRRTHLDGRSDWIRRLWGQHGRVPTDTRQRQVGRGSRVGSSDASWSGKRRPLPTEMSPPVAEDAEGRLVGVGAVRVRMMARATLGGVTCGGER